MPLQAFLPSPHIPPSISSVDLPVYPKVSTYTSQTRTGTPEFTQDASQEQTTTTIAISTDYTSHERPSEKAPRPPTDINALSIVPDTKMKEKKPAIIAAAGTLFSLLTSSKLYQNVLFERVTPSSEHAKNSTWTASSHSWVERKVCTWFRLCDIPQLNQAWLTTKAKTQKFSAGTVDSKVDLNDFWVSAQNPLDGLSGQEKSVIPKYVLDHAPLIHLYSEEQYWPCDIAEHLIHTTPHLNYTPLQSADDHPNLSNVDKLNQWGRFVYLQSDDNVEDYPDWLGGEVNIPDAPDHGDDDDDWERDGHGKDHFEEDKGTKSSSWWRSGVGDTRDKGGIRPVTMSPRLPISTTTRKDEELMTDEDIWKHEPRNRRRGSMGGKIVGGRSDAPAILIVVPKDDGVVDAFWFFFYSYNLGNAVFNVRFGNHVGDWEHTAVRFQNGIPKAVYYSEHAAGAAYTWDAVEKIGNRVILCLFPESIRY